MTPAAILIPIFEDGREGKPTPYFTGRTQEEIIGQREHFMQMFRCKGVTIIFPYPEEPYETGKV